MLPLIRNCSRTALPSSSFVTNETSAPSGMYGVNGSWKNEWIVTPPALRAATPVGATTAIRLRVMFGRLRRKVVFPVPAFPVRNTDLLVNFTRSCASFMFLSMASTLLQSLLLAKVTLNDELQMRKLESWLIISSIIFKFFSFLFIILPLHT